ncbi:hypothetical protein JW968_02765 [Candidatus Woesearchaeota archaeon]|nr:hypothetical protein [Candidatus Woesearchaeota archaeon]
MNPQHRKTEHKLSMPIISLLIFFSLAIQASGGISIQYECYENRCTANDFIKWEVNFVNDAEVGFTIKSIQLVNSKDAVIAQKIGINRFLNPEESILSSFSGTVPAPDQGDKVLYKPCLVIEIDETESTLCAPEYLNLTVEEFEGECMLDTDCEYGYECVDNTCQASGCGYCQYYLNGKCFEYDCCKDSECLYDEVCDEHRCQKLSCGTLEHPEDHGCVSGCRTDEYLSNGECVRLECSYDERAENHFCMPLNCGDDEYASNHECIKLQCAPDEYASGHRCIKLQCADDELATEGGCVKLQCDDDEYVFNHECKKLICAYDEFISNHKCVKLNCAEDEKAEHHTCVKLNCGALQKTVNHQCTGGGLLVFVLLGLFIGAVLIIFVAFLLSNMSRV